MLAQPAPISLRLDARPGLTLRSGDFVSVHVLNRIHGSRWAVSIQGRVIPAFSDLDLAAGAKLLARVTREQGRLVLRVVDRPPAPIQELLLRVGLPPDAASEQLVFAFLRSGLKVQTETVQQARRLIERLKLDSRRFSRIIALLLEKKLDLSSAGIQMLVELLGFGEGGRERERRYQPKSFPEQAGELAQELREELQKAGSREDNPLQLFNHLKGAQENWIIIPFRFEGLSGTIRLRCEPAAQKAGRMVLAVRDDRDERWSFVLDRVADGPEYAMRVFCRAEDSIPKGRRALQELQLKLQNLGVKTDDTIRVDDEFDGFSLPWESGSYRSIDTEG